MTRPGIRPTLSRARLHIVEPVGPVPSLYDRFAGWVRSRAARLMRFGLSRR